MDPDSPTKKIKSKSPIPFPLPESGVSEVLGLVELLRNRGGREDIYKLANELQMEYGRTLSVVRGAEVLSLVHTPGGDVVLEPLGMQISEASIGDKKEIISRQLEKIPFIRELREYLSSQENQEVTREEAVEKLAELVPNEDAEQTLAVLLQWSRYAELFGYNDDRQTFYLDRGDKTEEAS
ncbi:MAG: AAA-associated domain-containing protein [Bdellovibrionales bacterium]|nr:AAA-associated domain-containing protein [Bdellovibrionales bacterium]